MQGFATFYGKHRSIAGRSEWHRACEVNAAFLPCGASGAGDGMQGKPVDRRAVMC